MQEIARRTSFKLVIRKVERPFSGSPQQELDWICESFGFFGPGPRENAAVVFKQIVNATEKGKGLSSTEIANKLHLSRGSAINHLNNLLSSGLIAKQGHYYFARSKSMYRTIEGIEDEIDLLFQKMKKAAMQIDEDFGIQGKE